MPRGGVESNRENQVFFGQLPACGVAAGAGPSLGSGFRVKASGKPALGLLSGDRLAGMRF